ncbi:MAG: hypothetical protein CM1200mP30_20300 [Pseudomonadota bacterium]|nr:MAG: hypothetical protein CM1200mP30_20300 [Pseudomonadota bacterium]
MESTLEFKSEIAPGVFCGQKQVPMETAGCYVPGGRYAHVASAIMRSPQPRLQELKISWHAHLQTHRRNKPAILYTMNMCGADNILAIGGFKGIASLAFGLFTGNRRHPCRSR